jgi:hypothetical protein
MTATGASLKGTIGEADITVRDIVFERQLDADHSPVELALDVRDDEGRLVARGVVEVLWREPTNASSNGHAEFDLSPCVDGRVLT